VGPNVKFTSSGVCYVVRWLDTRVETTGQATAPKLFISIYFLHFHLYQQFHDTGSSTLAAVRSK
jgi:hypothetical protein